MQNIFLIICSILLPAFALNEVAPKLCVNCKFFTNSFLMNKKYGKCSLFPEIKTEKDIDYFVSGIEKKPELNYCFVARMTNDMCGKEGIEYVDKPYKSWYQKNLF